LQQSVDDIPDRDLVERAVRNAHRATGRRRIPRWSAVAETFGLGSTYSTQLCRRYGLDPDAIGNSDMQNRSGKWTSCDGMPRKNWDRTDLTVLVILAVAIAFWSITS